ncbi:MFS transporter [Arthrobacter sp. zg-Y1110]|uniref:MFS transporter n=1 Tax=Arthrobacter sp. zg-Y1110 TaxID=2886932 RepID=UPI001D1586EE|nr:MFS transporter [Arthrobacter sp. zg-Y1110]MCC3290922.1 MFS transporter [Arthrobacter sp. zg-Y1110]UWX86336.1 MFS transporter [Arthrobacter sp. zg-Y1110]
MKSSPSTSTKAAGGAVGFLIVMEFGSGLLQGWFPPLLARIGEDFSVDDAALNWVSVVYLLMTVAFVPVLGKLGDLYGHKRMLLVTVCLVAVGSVIVAFAPSFGVLLLGRALQAPLAAFLPLEFAIVRSRSEDTAGRSIAKLVGALTVGGAIGAMVSGILLSVVDNLTIVLLVPAVFMFLCIPVVAWLVPETTTRSAGTVDWAGAALLTTGLLSTLLGIANASSWGWTSGLTLGSIAFGLAVLVLWVMVERKVRYPLVDLHVLTTSGIGLPILGASLFGAQMFGSQTAGSLFILNDPDTHGFGLGLSEATVGVLFLVLALASFAGATLGDRIAARITAKSTVVLGALLGVASYVAMIGFSTSTVPFLAAMLLGAFGNGLILGVLPAIVVKKAPADSVAVASALYNTSRTAAGSVGGAVFALVMSAFLVTLQIDGETTVASANASYLSVWGICAALALALALVALRFRGNDGAAPDTVPAADTAPPASAQGERTA